MKRNIGVVPTRAVSASGISTRILGALLLYTAFAGTAAWAQVAAAQPAAPQPAAALPAALPAAPSPAAQQDPADSLYRAARAALNQGESARAADIFRSIHQRHPGSVYAADALYWEAFARYRMGGSAQFHHALAALELQSTKYPDAATRGDARALASRIQGELARLGDAGAAAAVTREATTAAMVGREFAAVNRDVAALQRDIASAQREMASTTRASARNSLRGQGSLPEGCSGEEVEIRIAALNALLQVDAERALPVLSQVLARRDPCSSPLRRTAIFLISQKLTPETETVLLGAAREDPDLQVRRSAVFHLSQVGTDRAVSVLEEILRTPADSALQEQALFALSQHGNDRARRALRTYTTRADAPVRLRGVAIYWVGQDRSADNAAFLQNLYRQLGDDQLKARVLFSIAQSGESANSHWLLRIANDTTESMQTRTTALYHAGTGNSLPIQELLALYDRLPERKLKEQSLYIFSQRDEPAALEKLIEIARREPDATLRKQAIYWLSRSEDPRATEVLLEIIGGT